MKQKQITTGKATIVVVDMPEGAHKINVVEGCYGNEYKDQIVYNLKEYTENQILDHIKQIDLPSSHWKLLGQFSQITEDQWKEIVESDYRGYKHYWKDNGFVPRGFNHRYKTATESGLSLLRAHGVVLENPLGVWNGLDGRPQTFPDGAQFNSAIELYNFQKKWDKAQSEVWKNPYIFIKL